MININSIQPNTDEGRFKGVKINISAYARDHGISWNTARRIILGIKPKHRTYSRSVLTDEFIQIIDNKVKNYQCSAVSLFYFIKEKGYTGSLSTVSKYIKNLKTDLINKAVIRIETSPGLQAQVDWKESMTLLSRSGEKYTFNIFLYILCYSKYKYIEITRDRTQDTLFRCMVNAFRYCGDKVPDEILFDNMKTVVDNHDVNTNEVTFNQTFLQFSKNCGFKPIACQPYRPQTKGLVENLARVMDRLKVQNNEFDDYNDLTEIIRKFNYQLNYDEICQVTGELPAERFMAKEKEYLSNVNLDQFDYNESPQTRKVSSESMVMYQKNKYSVPTDYLGKTVKIAVKDGHLYVYYNENTIAEHIITGEKMNYRREDLIQILHGVFPNDTEETIEARAQRRLEGYDVLLRGGKHAQG